MEKIGSNFYSSFIAQQNHSVWEEEGVGNKSQWACSIHSWVGVEVGLQTQRGFSVPLTGSGSQSQPGVLVGGWLMSK